MTAFLFAGQLAETVGMGRDFFESDASARELFGKTSERCGADFAAAIFDGPEEAIRDNRVAQPGVFLVSTLAARELARCGIAPSAISGYSLGNYAALVAAGAVSYDDALTILLAVLEESDRRGVRGAMGAVIGATGAEVEAICAAERDEGRPVWIGNVNAASQIVLSGSDEGVDSALAKLAPRALKAFRLPMTWPIHSPLMEGVSAAIAPIVRACESIRSPRVPFFSGTSAGRIDSDGGVRELLITQVARPSRWKETVEAMFAFGQTEFLEVGPGDTLTKMIRWIVREARCRPAGTIAAIDSIAAAEDHA